MVPRRAARVLFVIPAAVLGLAVASVAQDAAGALPPPPEPLDKHHFQQRRDALRAAVGDGVILVRGAEKRADMGQYQQSQDLRYLTGLNEPDLAVLLAPADDEYPVLDELLVPPFSPFAATWDGDFLAPGNAAAARTGFARATSVRSLLSRLDELLAARPDGSRPVLWTPLAAAAGTTATPGSASGAAQAILRDPLDGRTSRETALRDKLLERYPGLEVRDLSPLLARLRIDKTPDEIVLLRRSAEIAAEGIGAAMRFSAPGRYEFQLAAAARHVFSLRGAGPDAYAAIVGAGPNGCVLHYSALTRQLRDDDLIVMDYAATVHGYASDVTRTFPARGVFSPEQRRLVQDVYDIQQELIAMVKPGARLSAIGRRCSELLLSKGYRSDHGPCHHVGLAVHDPSSDVLRPGMVITVEPGAYLRDIGMGCRIEDTILVTETGCEVLSAGVPSSPDAVEAWILRDRR